MNTSEVLVLVTVAVGSVIIYLAVYPPEEEKGMCPWNCKGIISDNYLEQLSTSIFNRPAAPMPDPQFTKDGKQYQTVWPDVPEEHRMCEDGGRHSGSLELVTWDTPAEGLGWGCIVPEEAADHKKEFEVKNGPKM